MLPLLLAAAPPVRVMVTSPSVKVPRNAAIQLHHPQFRPNSNPNRPPPTIPLMYPPQQYKMPISKPHTIYIHQNAAPTHQPQYAIKYVPEHTIQSHAKVPHQKETINQHLSQALLKYLQQEALKQHPNGPNYSVDDSHHHHQNHQHHQHQEQQEFKSQDRPKYPEEVVKYIQPGIYLFSNYLRLEYLGKNRACRNCWGIFWRLD